ncbi:hypothetical protein ScPMuIL_017913 [Solemya velum]
MSKGDYRDSKNTAILTRSNNPCCILYKHTLNATRRSYCSCVAGRRRRLPDSVYSLRVPKWPFFDHGVLIVIASLFNMLMYVSCTNTGEPPGATEHVTQDGPVGSSTSNMNGNAQNTDFPENEKLCSANTPLQIELTDFPENEKLSSANTPLQIDLTDLSENEKHCSENTPLQMDLTDFPENEKLCSADTLLQIDLTDFPENEKLCSANIPLQIELVENEPLLMDNRNNRETVPVE